ncbi:MAG TPA: hypothetical protein VE131_02550, partial [Terriglobales bacterium]|nr:hypothetical protein [Terriglobales bacterium]
AACEILHAQKDRIYQPFTLVFANEDGAWAAHNGAAGITLEQLGAGLHVFSNAAEIDAGSEKITRAYRQFAAVVDSSGGRRQPPANAALAQVLGDHKTNGTHGPNDAICVHGSISGTVSSSIIRYSRAAREFQHFYSAGAPCQHAFALQSSLPVQ